MEPQEIIASIQAKAEKKWKFDWKNSLIDSYRSVLQAEGVEQSRETARSTVNRVFARGTCNLDTAIDLAKAVGLKLKLSPSTRK